MLVGWFVKKYICILERNHKYWEWKDSGDKISGNEYIFFWNCPYFEARNMSQSTIVSEGFKGGTRGSPIMPRDAVSRTANVERNGGHKWVTCFNWTASTTCYWSIFEGRFEGLLIGIESDARSPLQICQLYYQTGRKKWYQLLEKLTSFGIMGANWGPHMNPSIP